MTLVEDIEATRARRPGEMLPPPPVDGVAAATMSRPRSRTAPLDLLDIAGVATLTSIGLYGFRSSFGGWRFLVVGIVGLAVGVAIGALGVRRRLPAVVMAAATVLAFLLLSGLAQPRSAIARVLPSPQTVVDGLMLGVRGWARLLSTRPPVGSASGLLVVPLLCGLVAGILGYSFARRTRSIVGSVAGPSVVLALGILFGVDQPVSLIVQGSLFAGLAVAWIAARRARDRALVHGRSGRRRFVSAVAMVALASAAAYVVSSVLPFAHANPRFTLRERSEPPFDPLVYPSPLNGYRQYRDSKATKDAVYFSVTGLPEGARLRLAVMDDYDGLVWLAAGSPSANDPASGNFERVGDVIPAAPQTRVPQKSDTRATITIDVAAYAQVQGNVWIPGIGSDVGAGVVTAVHFEGPRKVQLEDQFRFNKSTGTGVIIGGVSEGDKVVLDVALPVKLTADTLAGAGKGTPLREINRTNYSEEILKKVTTYLTGQATTADGSVPPAAAVGNDKPYLQIEKLRAALIEEGSYSDGNEDDPRPLPPGHSVSRLARFLGDKAGIVGNYEQYAATLALMARNVGIPARVVLGFVPKGSGTVDVHGRDTQAWVEVNLAGIGWVTIDATPDENKALTDKPPVKRKVPNLDVQPPPPTSVPQADANAVSQLDKNDEKKADKKKDDAPKAKKRGLSTPVLVASAAVGGPVALGLLAAAGIVLAKSRRRRRRLRRGPPAERIAGSWREVVDRARDLGRELPFGATRREAALVLANHQSGRAAMLADAAVFGPSAPDDVAVATVWSAADEARQALAAPFGVVRRLRAHLSPRSLRRREPTTSSTMGRRAVRSDR